MPVKKAAKSQPDWDKANTKQFHLKFNLRTDADILSFLKSAPNKQGLIKRLIREEIARIENPDLDIPREYNEDSEGEKGGDL